LIQTQQGAELLWQKIDVGVDGKLTVIDERRKTFPGAR